MLEAFEEVAAYPGQKTCMFEGLEFRVRGLGSFCKG